MLRLLKQPALEQTLTGVQSTKIMSMLAYYVVAQLRGGVLRCSSAGGGAVAVLVKSTNDKHGEMTIF